MEQMKNDCNRQTAQRLAEHGKMTSNGQKIQSKLCAVEQIVYDFTLDRGREHPGAFLADWAGYIHTDGYAAYHSLPNAIVVLGCWVHMRRYFYEAYVQIPESARVGSAAEKGLAYCNALFEVERGIERSTVDERLTKRLKGPKPIVDAFFAWIDTMRVLPQSLMGKAEAYARSHRVYLRRFLLDGGTEFSNNRAERSFRTLVISRKNYLFSNCEHGMQVNAIYNTLLQTARENGLQPFEYLSRVFRDAPNGVPLECLLPRPAGRGGI
jgi:hypothetical protein